MSYICRLPRGTPQLVLANDELKRRLDAARTLRGLRQTDLAELLEADGHGKHDLGRLERGDFTLTRSLRRSLVEHLRVPEEWFTEPDLDHVVTNAQLDASQIARIDDRLERNHRLMIALAVHARIIEPVGAARADAAIEEYLRNQRREGTG